MYDIIGDIHGHAAPLIKLLKRMGYRHQMGAYRYPERKVIFLGDYIDRGPKQDSVVDTVRAMVDAGSAIAIMGNHEFNAVSFATPHPDQPEERLRKDTPNHRMPHQSFLNQMEEGSDEYWSTIDWFKTLPVYLDLPELRVIHACWHPESIERISPHLDENKVIREDEWVALNTKGHTAFDAIEVLLKGIEVELPEGLSYLDKDGIERFKTRTRWWQSDARSYREIGLVPKALVNSLPDKPVRSESIIRYDNEKPLFFGHYWMQGDPVPLGDQIACLDYSIAMEKPGAKLCAYRYDGERKLMLSRFCSVGL